MPVTMNTRLNSASRSSSKALGSGPPRSRWGVWRKCARRSASSAKEANAKSDRTTNARAVAPR